jgi:hypothetical protein
MYGRHSRACIKRAKIVPDWSFTVCQSRQYKVNRVKMQIRGPRDLPWGRCCFCCMWPQLQTLLRTLALAAFDMTTTRNNRRPSRIVWCSMQLDTFRNSCISGLHFNGLSLNSGKSEATIIGTGARHLREGNNDTVAVSKFWLPVLSRVSVLPFIMYYLSTTTLITVAKYRTTISEPCVISGIVWMTTWLKHLPAVSSLHAWTTATHSYTRRQKLI